MKSDVAVIGAALLLGLAGWVVVWSLWDVLGCIVVVGVGVLVASAMAHGVGADE